MKRIDFRIVIGVLLILGSVLGFLEKFGIIQRGWDLFWGTILGLAGIAFLYVFVTNRSQWWAAIPGFTLLGMSASSFLLDKLGWGGLAFLGAIGLGFWAIYLTSRERWWAIIPGGVLITLGCVSALSDVFGILNTGGVFFIGLGLTFLLVALLPGLYWPGADFPAGGAPARHREIVLGLLPGHGSHHPGYLAGYALQRRHGLRLDRGALCGRRGLDLAILPRQVVIKGNYSAGVSF